MKDDYFNEKSKIYETDNKRVDNVKNIAESILEKRLLKKSDTILDFGSGTGLLTEYISNHVNKIIANDISNAMNQKLKEKIDNNKFSCEIDILSDNITKEKHLLESLDGIISSMTIHHVKDIELLFNEFYESLKNGGILALADLETEDGSFHTEDTGVYHFGFDKNIFLKYAENAGFIDLSIKTVSIAEKPYGQYQYPIFLLIGKKP
ncbi:class I SAM-dependent DNA methyltransferase [Halarcobacter anaerophilus]|uniref:SAM-dependent methyltransferase n=1 Tax=Halarcobacter anaerophilus TaxID=877500 RepID=A0A4Q0Y0G8_9BACT|nr:class I SAM-dependent methyltransferase [Halarcobacter anaerophilus]QDF28866.1 SAM-dependent methyltransferase [Halarcobacter anaerophilus]RXJ63506.1 SAM-dependent methyltransferase [Halarcobacter anaerophilus]